MKKLASMIMMTGVLLAGGVVGVVGCKSNDANEANHVHTFSCPHHPEVVQSTAGTCPKCGMKLEHKH